MDMPRVIWLQTKGGVMPNVDVQLEREREQTTLLFSCVTLKMSRKRFLTQKKEANKAW